MLVNLDLNHCELIGAYKDTNGTLDSNGRLEKIRKGQ